MLFGPEHVKRYIETDGEVGHDWRDGVPTLILTTTGRRSGEPRPTPLIYGRYGDDYQGKTDREIPVVVLERSE